MQESFFDRYGNRWNQTLTAGSGPPTMSLAFGASGMGSSTTNRPNGYNYDSSGNMTVEPLVPQQNYMTYDGENRMTAVTGGGGGSYAYDGNGTRVVRSVTGGATTVSIFAGSSVIAEYDNGAAPSAPSREYVYNPAAGATTGLLAMISGGATTYYHQDHLSVRLTTDGTPGSPTYGQVLSQQGSYPYGEQWYQSGPGNKWFFTSYGRDSETGLDYALARYYDSRTGTFCSADPLAGDPSDPQSWNRYPYGRNNPIMATDPSGQFFELLIPMLDALFASVEAAIPTVVTTVEVTATVSPTWLETATPFIGASLPLAAAVPFSMQPPGGGPQQKPPSAKQRPECDRSVPLNAQKLDWIKAHLADATKVANQVGTTASNILGISALEGGWGQGPFVVNGGNNFFGQHFPAPFGGPSPIPGHAVPMAQFPNYATSAESFAKQNGGLIRNVTDPTQFARNLQNSGKFGIDPTTGKPVPDYVSNTSGTIKGLQKRIDCPQ